MCFTMFHFFLYFRVCFEIEIFGFSEVIGDSGLSVALDAPSGFVLTVVPQRYGGERTNTFIFCLLWLTKL